MALLAFLLSVIALTTTPASCFEPCTVKLTIKLPAPDQIKEVCIYLDGLGMERKSCWPPSAKTTETPIKNIPAGDYVVWATALQAGTSELFSTPKRSLVVISNK